MPYRDRDRVRQHQKEWVRRRRRRQRQGSTPTFEFLLENEANFWYGKELRKRYGYLDVLQKELEEMEDTNIYG